MTDYHRSASPDTFALHDAQFVLARSYGFESWPKLKAAIDGVTGRKLHEAAESGDLRTARELLTRRPEIVETYREAGGNFVDTASSCSSPNGLAYLRNGRLS